jgi:hypothetical protein
MLVVAQIERSLDAILIVPVIVWVLPAFLALGLSNKATLIGRIGAPTIAFAVIAALMLNGASQTLVQRPEYMADAITASESKAIRNPLLDVPQPRDLLSSERNVAEAPWEREQETVPTVRDIEVTLSSGARRTYRDVPNDVTIAEVKERVWRDYQEIVSHIPQVNR